MAGKKGDDDGWVGEREELPKRFCSWPLDKVGKGDTTMVNLQHASRQEKLDDINTHFIYQ